MAAPAVAGLLLMTRWWGPSCFRWLRSWNCFWYWWWYSDWRGCIPNYTAFTDPAVSTLYNGAEAYQETIQQGIDDPDVPNDPINGGDLPEGDYDEDTDLDENPYNGESPWEGYDPDLYYYETVGNIKGQLGTYNMSTGPVLQQATLKQI